MDLKNLKDSLDWINLAKAKSDDEFFLVLQLKLEAIQSIEYLNG